MYLKSIEVHGFKSFANKIVFQFHNGITAIVGPNGSGKSNVADAVRWVLGEQSAKQLRGASMQDVIFAGTESRKPLGYASVSITLDNGDHQLPVSYDEVTVTRRVYRSGESEYLLNGTQVRLKDINELFYDTGIGKEGYSIIGQGQIEKILSGKPEERRELFDEAAGIVKFKRRKNTAVKKLEAERQNLVRVTDILSELRRQIGPMEKQAEKAREYLKLRDELKGQEISLFLGETARIRTELAQTEENLSLTESQLETAKGDYERARTDYEGLEEEIAGLEKEIQEKQEEASRGKLKKQQLENQIELSKEQINTARTNEEHLKSRKESAAQEIARCQREKEAEEERQKKLQEELEQVSDEERAAGLGASSLRQELSRLGNGIDSGKNEIIGLLNQRGSLKAGILRYDTMAEQARVRKAELMREALSLKTEESRHEEFLASIKEEEEEINRRIEGLNGQSEEASVRLEKIQGELSGYNQKMEEIQKQYHQEASRLESLKNITERYDGYGNSIRRVMEQKKNVPGILGVVADLIKVGQKYETAIETALGGSIQNIVTDTEATAKRMIGFLKQNRFGRATFLPLNGITLRGGKIQEEVLREPGVIGTASSLVKTQAQFESLKEFLLGKTVVAQNIDDAVALAGKYRHSLRIVTLEGELLSPGGSMSGGAFKNSGNLLGRRREIEELEEQVKKRRETLEQLKERIDNCRSERNRLRDQLVALKDQLQKEFLEQNTIRMKREELEEKKKNAFESYEKIQKENEELERQLADLKESQDKEKGSLAQSQEEEERLQEEIAALQKELEEKQQEEKEFQAAFEEIHLKLARIRQEKEFSQQNLSRIQEDSLRFQREEKEIEEGMLQASAQIQKKLQEIESIKEAVLGALEEEEKLGKEISVLQGEKEKKAGEQKTFFQKREEISSQMNLLDRECFRLNAHKEKLTEQQDAQTNHMWEEYGLTYGAALEASEGCDEAPAVLKKKISELKGMIKSLGNVNVNAIEDFKELSERNDFLTAQYEDLQKAEAALMKIIEELDEGMRVQFKEQFERIRTEFDKAFKQLFGGGRGTLELVEEEDILEAGIRIVAQPPGKKLQNMMQLSGGEKSLTAIALLFAIQNLKPSPFCLLDEIEAALDESNVDRYASYLHKLTKNTQFIIITHRRGTMTAADRLYGITMQEKGVSALVSVNLIEEDLDQ